MRGFEGLCQGAVRPFSGGLVGVFRPCGIRATFAALCRGVCQPNSGWNSGFHATTFLDNSRKKLGRTRSP
ncbi:MAG TPA: hypothetical protein DC058_00930 [Planctomycetaceae bacterium]|nr:hypothetical protein [Planctomycetaceae bacterium]HBC59767.1 hypothetical protein [Planctomycetaceae bacterium]